MSKKHTSPNMLKHPLTAARTLRTRLLSASILTLGLPLGLALGLAFGAATSHAQVGVQMQRPIAPQEPVLAPSGPDADKELVQKRWDIILGAPSPKEAKKAKSAPQAAAPQAATPQATAPQAAVKSPDDVQKSASQPDDE